MQTNIVIDDDLLKEAFLVSNYQTEKDLIHEALSELIRLRKRKDLTELAGSIEFYKDYKIKRPIRGKYKSIPTSSEIFANRKQDEINLER